MKWEKKGKIFDRHTLKLDWFKTNAMMPLPFVLNERVLRIFVTLCDEDHVGRIGYVDVDADDPSMILDYSKKPVIDIGEAGTYDDNGVVTGSLFEEDGRLYLFYSGFQLAKKVPYMIFAGAALSTDGGKTFEKLNREVPMLERIPGERNFRCAPNIIKRGDTYQMWYHADGATPAWITNEAGKQQPVYSERYMESEDLLTWTGAGSCVLPVTGSDEHGLTIGTVWTEDGIYKCIYSVRSLSKGYRLGYAESPDGKMFTRRDDELGLDVTPGSFDSEMMCYAERIMVGDKVYLFYSGNGYGTEGIGYAVQAGQGV